MLFVKSIHIHSLYPYIYNTGLVLTLLFFYNHSSWYFSASFHSFGFFLFVLHVYPFVPRQEPLLQRSSTNNLP
jgi:hypothetical protein